MTAHLRLFLGERDAALTAPRAALRHREGRSWVVVARDGRWVDQAVTIGWRSEQRVEILEGLAEGERLELNREPRKE